MKGLLQRAGLVLVALLVAWMLGLAIGVDEATKPGIGTATTEPNVETRTVKADWPTEPDSLKELSDRIEADRRAMINRWDDAVDAVIERVRDRPENKALSPDPAMALATAARDAMEEPGPAAYPKSRAFTRALRLALGDVGLDGKVYDVPLAQREPLLSDCHLQSYDEDAEHCTVRAFAGRRVRFSAHRSFWGGSADAIARVENFVDTDGVQTEKVIRDGFRSKVPLIIGYGRRVDGASAGWKVRKQIECEVVSAKDDVFQKYKPGTAVIVTATVGPLGGFQDCSLAHDPKGKPITEAEARY